MTYKGDVAAGEIFNIENLSAFVVQIKYKVNADTQAGRELRPIGISRNIHQPLPYLALLMELGTESNHQEAKSQILVNTSPMKDVVKFESLWKERDSAVQNLNEYMVKKKEMERTKETKKQRGRAQDPQQTELEEKVQDAQAKIDAINRFSIFVRGASSKIYGILSEAKIVDEFAHLLKVTLPSPVPLDITMKEMHPLERMDETSDQTAWMFRYTMAEDRGGEDGERAMDVD